jgi:DNA-binding transcriptional ArsR family regulator
MVNYNAGKLDLIFSALSDSTRRTMLQRLAEGEMSVMELAAPFDMTKPAVTKHLKVLEKAGLLQRQIIGRTHRCRLMPQPLGEAAGWIAFYEKFWNMKFDALDKYLNDTSKKKGKKVG